jgi:hypothetical protein
VYDYVDGKADWMAFALPVEGDDGPFAGQAVSEVPTCDAGGTAADARAALDEAGTDVAIVVSCHGLAVGAVDRDALAGADPGAPLLDVMEVVPGTVRPSVTLDSLSGRSLVTTSDGRLLGEVVPDEHHHHDHHDDLGERMERELSDTLEAVHERFGDQEPPEGELRSFLRERLVDEGRTPEEADELMAHLGDEEG